MVADSAGTAHEMLVPVAARAGFGGAGGGTTGAVGAKRKITRPGEPATEAVTLAAPPEPATGLTATGAVSDALPPLP